MEYKICVDKRRLNYTHHRTGQWVKNPPPQRSSRSNSNGVLETKIGFKERILVCLTEIVFSHKQLGKPIKTKRNTEVIGQEI
jgi:hypothetical protein